MAWTFAATARGYAKMWGTAAVKQGQDDATAERFARKIIDAESRYKAVQSQTGVPWFFIGALHMRESSCNFDGVLHNGDRIIGTGGLTTHVPAGRGPFATWEDAAVDALKLKDMHRVQSWSVERMLYQAEVFNGLGYVGKGVNSPYVWAGTNLEQSGKYVADHVFSFTAEDTQLGVAAVLLRLAELRPDIKAALVSDTPVVKPPKPPTEVIVMPDPTVKPGQQPDMQQLLQVLVTLMTMLLQGRVAPQPPPTPVEKPPETIVVTTPPPPPPPPVLEKPSVQLGTAGLMISTVLQALGIVGTPFGMGAEPTQTGTLATLIPLATTVIGATGGFGSLLSIGLRIVGALASSANQSRK